MTVYEKIKPDEDGLAIALASKALKAARGMSTANPGSIYIPNGDGTGTLIGAAGGIDQTGGPNGVVPWIGDTTPPGKPTGVSAKCRWGILTASWDGTLEGGVPADFAFVLVALDGMEIGRLQKAGDVTVQGLEDGRTVTVSFTACDDAHDRLGNPAPNASDAVSITITVSDERAEIDADVAEARKDAADAAQAAQAASEKADSFQEQITDATAAVNGVVQEVSELSQSVSGAVSDASQALTTATQAKQTADAISDTASRAYENASEALTQSSSAVQTATGIKETLESDYLSKDEAGGLYATQSELERTADEISLSVEQVRDESVMLDGCDGPVAVIGKNAGMAPFGIDVEGVTRQNLWDQVSKTQNGITVTANSNGSITLSGTSTSSTLIIFDSSVYALKPGGTYTFSVDKLLSTSSDAGGFFIQRTYDGSSTTIVYLNGTTTTARTFTVPDNTESCKFGLQVLNGHTVSGTYRVMLNEGSEPQPWCPPGLNSVEDVTVWQAGKNLMPTKEYKSQFWTRDLGDAIKVVNSLTGLKMVLKYEVTLLTADDPSLIPTSRTGAILMSNAGVYHTSQVAFGSGFQIEMVKTITYCFMVPEGDRIDHFYTYGCGNSNDSPKHTNGTADVRILLRPATEEDNWSKGAIYTVNGPIPDDEWDGAPVTFTEVPLLGNRLRSLPDGTRDSLSVDSAGNVTMVKRVGIADAGDSASWIVNPNFADGKRGFSLAKDDAAVYQDAQSASPMCNALSVHQIANASMRDGSVKHTTGRSMIARCDACTDIASWRAWLSSSGFQMLYALEEPQTIPLGHVDLPELPADGATMWVVAEDAFGNSSTLEPKTAFRWYGENAEALGQYATSAQLKVEADAIRAEVSENYVDKETGDATYAAKSDVEQLPDQILSTVEKTYQSKEGMGSYYTKSEIDQKDDAIELSVSQAVDDISVGGRNLILDSYIDETSGLYGFASRSLSIDLVAGETYAFYANGRVINGSGRLMLYVYTPNWSTSQNISTSSKTDTTFGKIFTASVSGTYSFAAYSYLSQGTAGGDVHLNWVKLEKGNKPTDWTPAPEDAEKKMASLEVDIEGISSTVSDLDGRVSTVEQTASGFEVRLGEAEDDASSALTKANSAASAASTAQSTASSAATAAAAANKVFYANSTTAAATKAKTATVSGSGFALVVGVTVSVRFQYANTANSPTLNVNSTGAKPIVSNGTATPTANLTWNAAWATVTFVYDGSQWRISGDNSIVKANSAQSTANTANTTANAAKTAASNAQSTANTANSTANAAKTAAANAQTAANNAAKTATNYLKFDSAGLCVGNHTGTLGYNTLIKSTGVDIRNGSTVLASFGASVINLGANSNTAAIGFANGSGGVRGYSDSYYGRTIDIVRGNRSYIRLGDTHLACDIGAGGDGYFAFDAHTEGPVAYISGTVSTGATSEESCNVPMSRLIDLLKDMAHPVGSVMILKGSMSPTPNDLGFPGTWSVCAIGMRVVGTGLGFAGSQVHVNNDWSMGVEPYDGGWDEVFWLDLFPNSGNSTRTASTVWLRTA